MVYHTTMRYTVRQLSRLAGISVRTLHHYHTIGLLEPESVGANGYRYYGDESILRLQQILFYRELGFPLAEIRSMLEHSDFDPLEALGSHRLALAERIEHLKHLIQTVDDTILHLKGQKEMSKKQLFEVFNEEQQAEYEKEAMQMYDPATVKASMKKWKSYTTAEKERIGEEGNAAYDAILAAMPKGAASPEAQAGIERWRKHMDYFWTPNPDQLLGLAEMYNTDPRFKANFDKIDPRLAAFMVEAVKIYVARLK
jgi:DNA-binding transcriptional MerR regulator